MLHEPADWRQLPSILEGLAKARSTPLLGIQEKIIRHAIQGGQFNIILQCLRKPELTGMTLKHDEILNLTLGGLHQTAQTNGWDQEHVGQALRFAGVLAELLEQDGHTRGKTPRSVVRNDPRTNPKVIGVFLEIAAVNAYKYHDGKDEDGSVMKYAARMMSCFENYEEVRASAHVLTLSGHVANNERSLRNKRSSLVDLRQSSISSSRYTMDLSSPPRFWDLKCHNSTQQT